MTGERGELLDARLHVVPGDPLARGDRVRGRPARRPSRSASIARRGTSMPRSRWACSTAIQSRAPARPCAPATRAAPSCSDGVARARTSGISMAASRAEFGGTAVRQAARVRVPASIAVHETVSSTVRRGASAPGGWITQPAPRRQGIKTARISRIEQREVQPQPRRASRRAGSPPPGSPTPARELVGARTSSSPAHQQRLSSAPHLRQLASFAVLHGHDSRSSSGAKSSSSTPRPPPFSAAPHAAPPRSAGAQRLPPRRRPAPPRTAS